MTRRQGPRGWDDGLRGRRRRSGGQVAVLIGVGLAVVIVLWLIISKACAGGGGCDKYYCVSGQHFEAPQGYSFASDIFEYNKSKGAPPQGQAPSVQLPLKDAKPDARNLSFFQYDSASHVWEPLAPANVAPGSSVAQGVLNPMPAIIAVLQRTSPGGAVVAYLPHNGTLAPDAVGKITILHTLDFTPAADGSVSGQLSNVTPDGSFQWMPVVSAGNSIPGTVQTVQTVLASAASRTQQVQAIVTAVQDSKLAGVDIAYQDLTVNERSSFTLFIQELAEKLHNAHKQLTLTVPPPVVTANRVDEGAYDWAALGQAADLIELAPYRDQGTYRQAMPQILQYIGTKVHPSSKVVLTVSPYASEKSDAGITTLTIAQAMAIASQIQVNVSPGQPVLSGRKVIVSGVNIDKSDGRSGIVWQPETACVAFTYEQEGGRTVWIENFYSIGFKLAYIGQYQLGGVAVDDASNNELLGNIWTAIVPYISSGEPILRQPNPKDLQPTWDVSNGQWQDTLKGEISWSTPAQPGAYTIKLTLSDGIAKFQNQVSVDVIASNATATTTAAGTP
ncbi:hypothetical protein J0H33_10105 [bacterium]|nr:hypothetical protein [bacterium]